MAKTRIKGKRTQPKNAQTPRGGSAATPRTPGSASGGGGRPSALLDTRVIYCGDCLEQLKNLPPSCVDLIYIDPPFNSNRNYDPRKFWGETKEKRSFEDRHASTQAYIDYMRPRCEPEKGRENGDKDIQDRKMYLSLFGPPLFGPVDCFSGGRGGQYGTVIDGAGLRRRALESVAVLSLEQGQQTVGGWHVLNSVKDRQRPRAAFEQRDSETSRPFPEAISEAGHVHQADRNSEVSPFGGHHAGAFFAPA
ncbi:MAG: hypothetical protein WD042_10410 [Phycisphaeraceae bacterium]